MEILNKFGFDTALFIAQIVNFLILAFIFKKYLYKPILKVLRDRQNKIKQGLEDAESAQLQLARASEERDEILRQAGSEAEKIIENTRVASNELKESILKAAESDASRIIKEAKEQARLEMEKMESKVGSMSLDLSKKILDKVLSSLLSENEKKQVMKKGLEAISKVKVD